MFFLVSGLRTSFTLFGFRVVECIAKASFGDVQTAQVDNLERFYEALKSRSTDAMVVFLQNNESRITTLLRRTQSKVVVFGADVSDAAALFIHRYNRPFAAAVRVSALAAAGLAELCESASVVLYPKLGVDAKLLPLVQSLALFYGIDPDKAFLKRVAKHLRIASLDSTTTIGPLLHKFWLEGTKDAADMLSDEERGILDALDQSYGELMVSGGYETVSWPIGALYSPIEKQIGFSSPVELVGQARRLTYGPYLHLPAGDWLFESVLSVSENQSGNKMEVILRERHTARAQTTFDLPARGRLAVTLRFMIENVRNPVEIYFSVKEAGIEGIVEIESLRFQKYKPDEPSSTS
ncbi:hypothetical protein LQ948_02250 [Jiella sp. MQZ9-1]|uniref:Uncharacterized protein n=1 Tax=Jiella flava TaxID=2816857 RepID=A0A939JSS1_9HYPH|nr:hypothetical protein [Jiella flava]MBO0661385.1 hypothetical protein [Jiella flava]MCD2470029.1 hypothetical protein [Jiella flava]